MLEENKKEDINLLKMAMIDIMIDEVIEEENKDKIEEYLANLDKELNVSKKSFGLYLDEINRLPKYTFEEQLALFRQMNSYEHGSPEYDSIRNILITANVKLVVSIAAKYLNKGLDIEDLVSEGQMGLLKAVEKFDENNGARFSTYAYAWIKQSIELALQKYGRDIKVPMWIKNEMTRILRAEDAIRAERNNSSDYISDADIAAAISESESLVHDVREIMDRRSSSLCVDEYQPSDQDDDRRTFQIIDNQDDILDIIITEEGRKALIALIDKMPKQKYRDILKLRFGLTDRGELTLQEIGDYFREQGLRGVTRESVRQLEHKALNLLRSKEYAEELRRYYGRSYHNK